MFGDSFIVPTRYDFEVLSEYKSILSKLISNNYNRFFFYIE